MWWVLHVEENEFSGIIKMIFRLQIVETTRSLRFRAQSLGPLVSPYSETIIVLQGSLGRPGFSPRVSRVGFVVEEVAEYAAVPPPHHHHHHHHHSNNNNNNNNNNNRKT
jgi:hypothetical protein